MIAKTIKNTGSGSVANSVDYAQRQGAHKERDRDLSPELKPQVVLLNNLTYSDAKNVSKEFKMVNGFNKNIAENKKHIHEVVSFSSKDIQKLDSPEKRAEATEKYLENKGISKENFQYIAIEHKDTNNVHVHIIHNRVGLNGEVYKASANYERSAAAQERTEKQFNLDNGIERKVIYAPEESRGYKKNPNYGKSEGIVKTPKNRRINDKREKERVLTDKQKRIIIQKEIKNTLSQSDISDINKFKNALGEKGILVEDRYNKEKKLTGVKFIYKEHNATGTQVGYKANTISSTLEENKLKQKEITAERKNIDRENIKPLPKVEIESREIQELRKDTLQNLDKAIEKIEPYKEANLKTYESVKTIKEGVQRNELNSKEDLQKINQMAKNHISNIEAQEQKPEISRFEQAKSNREEKQEQNQEQEKKRGFRR